MARTKMTARKSVAYPAPRKMLAARAAPRAVPLFGAQIMPIGKG